jgi:hypothetical protein
MASTNSFSGIALIARLRAAGMHVCLSLTAVWYPQPYFMADGGWRVLQIIVLVDVVLGPLLTLIVFNRAKPELKRDLAIIAVIQIGALFYGAGTMYQYRPVFLAAAEQNLFTVNWPDLERANKDLTSVRALGLGKDFPLMVDIKLPESTAQREAVWSQSARDGIPPSHQAQRFAAMTPARLDGLLRPGINIDAMAKTDAEIAAELAQVLKRHPELPRERLAFVPLNCRFELIILVFDRETRRVIDWMT